MIRILKNKTGTGAVVTIGLATALAVFAQGLPAPVIEGPPDGSVYTLAEVNQGGMVMQWQAVDGATGYEVEIVGPPEFGERDLSAAQEETSRVFPLTTASGFYYWRVRALGAQDQPGVYALRRIVYIGVQPDPTMPFDLFRDGKIDELDLLLLLRAIREESIRGDLNGDNQSTGQDLVVFSSQWMGEY